MLPLSNPFFFFFFFFVYLYSSRLSLYFYFFRPGFVLLSLYFRAVFFMYQML